MPEKEYIIFWDESDMVGRYYSNFYGGLIIGASQYEKITRLLNEKKRELNLHHEVKWGRVTQPYLQKYCEFICLFFKQVIERRVKVRIFFRQNVHKPKQLTKEQIDTQYFRLYYQLIKHAFGLGSIDPNPYGTRLRLYFDQFPDTGEKVDQFKGFILGLRSNTVFKKARIIIKREDITEVLSKDHVLLQCLDVVLGSMSFRLNDKHKEIPTGKKRRGKRTIAKHELYKTILAEIRKIHPNFNVGITTGGGGDMKKRWKDPYLHWSFLPREREYDERLTKGRNKNG